MWNGSDGNEGRTGGGCFGSLGPGWAFVPPPPEAPAEPASAAAPAPAELPQRGKHAEHARPAAGESGRGDPGTSRASRKRTLGGSGGRRRRRCTVAAGRPFAARRAPVGPRSFRCCLLTLSSTLCHTTPCFASSCHSPTSHIDDRCRCLLEPP